MGILHYSSNIAKECNNTNCAVIFHHLLFWIEKNRRLKKMCYDNCYWVYQSYSQLEKRFHNHLSKRQIRTALTTLEKKGLIISSNKYSDTKDCGVFKSTKWYTIPEYGYEILDKDIEYVEQQIDGSMERRKIKWNNSRNKMY